ncbi:MAG TPA: four helix bundle protein [Verrucomicrobiota bacterium]|nr:four helix bundle protein [Verrucomicrobiota bacterium]
MATAQQFEDLGVWQDARALVKAIYTASKQRQFYRDAGLREQVRRAATSVMSNIAEGFERGSRKEFVQFLNIAKGSNGEVRSQLYVALDQEYVSQKECDGLIETARALSRRLAKFIRYLETYPSNSRVRKSGNR